MNEEIGRQLRQAREARNLTVEQTARAIVIRAHYIEAMERGDFDAIPSRAQARGFLRSYVTFLKLDESAILAALDTPGGVNEAPATESASRPKSPPPASPGEAEAIFIEIGQTLRQRREMLGLSLEDVARHTHLRIHYLAALEDGNLAALPSSVQGRGMLDNYGNFLGLDSGALLLRFADGVQARFATRQAEQARSTPKKPRSDAAPRLPFWRRIFSVDAWIGLVLTLALVGFVLWGAIRIFTLRADQPIVPTAPSIADVLLALPSYTPTLTPPPATATPPQPLNPQDSGEQTAVPGGDLALTPNANGGVQIYLTIAQRAWMRILVDGEVEFDGRVRPGSAYSFAGAERVEVITGNGAALEVFFNQNDLGSLGKYGEVVDRIFTLDGQQTPTATITPTATATPKPSPTAPGSSIRATPAAPALP